MGIGVDSIVSVCFVPSVAAGVSSKAGIVPVGKGVATIDCGVVTDSVGSWVASAVCNKATISVSLIVGVEVFSGRGVLVPTSAVAVLVFNITAGELVFANPSGATVAGSSTLSVGAAWVNCTVASAVAVFPALITSAVC